MKMKLSSKEIYEDFLYKMKLTEEELKVLNLYLKDYSYTKMSIELNMSERNIGRIVSKLKEKYEMYRKLELAKLQVFLS